MDVSEEPVDLTKSSNSSMDQRPDTAQRNNQKCVQLARKFISTDELSVPQPAVSSANSFVLDPSAVPTFVKPIPHKPCSESKPSVGVSRRSDAFMLHSNLYNRKSEYMDVISQTELQGEKNHEANSRKTAAVQDYEVPMSVFDSAENYEKSTSQGDKFDSFGKSNKFEVNIFIVIFFQFDFLALFNVFYFSLSRMIMIFVFPTDIMFLHSITVLLPQLR